MMNNNNEEIYNEHILGKIEKINSLEVSGYMWSKIKVGIIEKEISDSRLIVKEAFLKMLFYPNLKVAIATMAVFLFTFLSVSQYHNYQMYNNVNAYLGEYVSYVSSDGSMIEGIGLYNNGTGNSLLYKEIEELVR